jgi:hypothetical protein
VRSPVGQQENVRPSVFKEKKVVIAQDVLFFAEDCIAFLPQQLRNFCSRNAHTRADRKNTFSTRNAVFDVNGVRAFLEQEFPQLLWKKCGAVFSKKHNVLSNNEFSFLGNSGSHIFLLSYLLYTSNFS